jgi:hypothetical protein
VSGAQRSTSRWKEAGRVHHAVGFDLRQQRELRVDHRHSGEVDVVAALLGEDFGEPRRAVRLKVRRPEIAIAGLVRLV